MKEKDMIKAILDMGTKRGTLTYDEINDALLMECFSLDELEDFMNLLDRKGIKVVDYDKRRN
ncbi:MAG TPA: RNA polymerase sigma factor region1.1 domain-containing protein [Thermodesulfovibrionales bacterium]|nr:RNA polymerase sigma factor region1.1 domain-containing protein [Thermodesulfovibrionales bacterium]